MKIIGGSIALTVTVVLGGCSSSDASHTKPTPEPGAVSRADLGKKWPLTVNRGRLDCIGVNGVGAVLFNSPNGTEYAVNGIAKGKLPDVQPIDPIWADDGSGLGLKGASDR